MSNEKKPLGPINRRDLLKAMTVAPAVALVQFAPAAARAAATPVSGTDPSEAYQPKVFNPHEWKTLQVLSDLIIPADEHSGSATQAGVPVFIDEWLELKGGLLKTEVLGELTWLDVESNRQFGHDFADSSEAQQKQLLDRIAYPRTAAPQDANAVAGFSRIRDVVLGGFYSSKMGIEDLEYKGNKMLSEWNGCPEDAVARLDVNYSDWEYWKSPTTVASGEN